MNNFESDERTRQIEYLKSLPDGPVAAPLGVLLSDEIRGCVKRHRMIEPFEEQYLRAASYELGIGNEYSVSGKPGKLSEQAGDDGFEIPAFEVAIVKTYEQLNIPRNVIARWNIKVGRAYEGLVWVGGPQVDPGWAGFLSCPIYNLSKNPVKLRYKERIAVMDFVVTSPLQPLGWQKDEGYKRFERPPKRVLFRDYEPEKLVGGLSTALGGLREDVKELKQEMRKLRDTTANDLESNERKTQARLDTFDGRLNTFIGVTYTALSIIVAALSIFVTSGSQNAVGYPVWTYLTVGISVTAFSISLLALRRRNDTAGFKRSLNVTVHASMGFLGGVICVIIAMYLMRIAK